MNGPPSTLGQYQIIREIARSNDIVYEAYDPTMNRRVAIKEMAVPGGSSPQQREERINRFKREAQAAGTLNHPNIMTVFSFAEDAGRIFMALEYLDGSTLRNEIDTKGFIPTERAMEIAKEILAGLNHAHNKGVIHRDIKPDNIQILSNGTIKITDFGIARLTFQPNLTMDGQVFGTPSYMSPEQVVGKEIDARSDLFSVGVLLYEMVSGQKPFSGDSVVSITYAIMNTEPAKPQQCSPALWEVIRKALDKSPMMRYGSAEEMSNALDRVGMASATPPPPQVTPYNAPAITNPYQANLMPPPVSAPPAYNFNPYSNTAVPNGSVPLPGPNPYVQNPYAQNPYGQNAPPGPYNQAHYHPNSMPPPGFPQVFYPPPPRGPLVKPETADFLKRLVIALVVIGTLFALLFVALGAIISSIQVSQAERADQGVVMNLDQQMDPRIPVEERIDNLRRLRAQLHTAKNQDEIDKRIATLLALEGQDALRKGQTDYAEKYFQDAITTNGNDPALYTYLASLYEDRAQAVNSPAYSMKMWQLSGQAWQGAYEHQPAGETRTKYGNGAATAFYNYAYQAVQTNTATPLVTRQVLYDAKALAEPGSVIAQRVEDLLTQLR